MRVNISGCTNSCGQHHISDIGFFGLERRAHGRAAPGYQMLLGGHLADTEVQFGEKATKIPAKNAPEAVVRVVRRFNDERQAGETFPTWLARSGGAAGVGESLDELDVFPAPDVGPEFYVDYDETGPYVADVGDGECAQRHELARLRSGNGRPPAGRHRSGRARGGVARAREQARVGGDQVGVGALRDRHRARGVVPGLRARRRRSEGRARHRGRVPRHAVPLRRDALVRRPRPRALRPEPHRDAAARPARRPVADRPRRMLRDAQGRAARPRARRQAGLDDRPAPRRGADPGERADRAPRHRPRHREGQPARDAGPTPTSRRTSAITSCSSTRSPRRATPRSAAGRAPVPSSPARTRVRVAGPKRAKWNAASTAGRIPRRRTHT